jgi:subtilisin family serine protease
MHRRLSLDRSEALHSSWRPRLTLGALIALICLALPTLATAAPTDDRFVVVLEDGVTHPAEVAREHGRRYEAQVGFVYRHALEGYSARVPGRELGALRSDRRVAFVERDRRMQASTFQASPPWGLDRIDQRSRPLSGTFRYTSTGAGVTAYIIDTGIRFSHANFGGRAVDGFDAVDPNTPAEDCNGHGTHVAGTTGGATYGVAKEVELVAVRVLDCAGSGSYSGVLAGIDWVTADHDPGEPAVANMSLGGSASSAVDAAVRGSIADGVTYTVAAGNDWRNACNFSPARVSEAITVSATNSNDSRPAWANYGSCVDFFAPGVSIRSAWYTSDTAANTISGTSMAAPHAAGVAALYLQRNPSALPQTVRDALYAKTTKGIVTRSKTANRHLLFTDY